ncbi:hypothetical protein [Loktanella sp. Alg231-35]|uniref:hypothetical protein n=1 Tax=Loktanella sp. Alg231-35 TaxID=1922220 RepID=UPI00131F1CFE|nr:hypothetical protein [Loktanella sp. Alg231-35]
MSKTHLKRDGRSALTDARNRGDNAMALLVLAAHSNVSTTDGDVPERSENIAKVMKLRDT